VLITWRAEAVREAINIYPTSSPGRLTWLHAWHDRDHLL